jgi:phytoene/squalene synthetase
VDTFHAFDKQQLFDRFKNDTYTAIEEGISLNPILQSFQLVINKYEIDSAYIDAFLKSMEMDLHYESYSDELYKEYIYGSAEVVGLMCLQIFCEKDKKLFNELAPSACNLGAAFQKINFLRDIKSDFIDRGRTYFPSIDFNHFTEKNKAEIEKDIQNDFNEALKGIRRLPMGSRFGVYLAYIYYINLFKKIKRVTASTISEKRIRVSDRRKIYLLATSALRHQLNLL